MVRTTASISQALNKSKFSSCPQKLTVQPDVVVQTHFICGQMNVSLFICLAEESYNEV